MTMWKLRCGNVADGRDYGHVCISTGLALLGTDWLAEQLHGIGANPQGLDLEVLRNNEHDNQRHFVHRFDSMEPGDIVALVHGNSCRAIGLVQDIEPLAIAAAHAAQLLDIDGWCLPIARAVNWRVPPPPNAQNGGAQIMGLSTNRFSQVHVQGAVDLINNWHDEAFLDNGAWGHGQGWVQYQADAAVVVDPGVVPMCISARALYYRNEQPRSREHEIVTHLVVPFIQHLGWMAPQQIEIEAGFIDLVLYEDNNRQIPRVLIEAKKAWGSVTGSLPQVRYYYYNNLPEEQRHHVNAIATTTGTRWAVWTIDHEPKLRAYCDLASPAHFAEHPLLKALALPCYNVGGLSQVMELLGAPQGPGG
ncbi:MAG: hypothetical protein RL698_238 [Pseudomonadota bacterium]|jgi:hypothetical protein